MLEKIDELRIERHPNMASSILTVSVPWSGKKFTLREFCKLFIFLPSISCSPLFVEPKTTKTGFSDLFNSLIYD